MNHNFPWYFNENSINTTQLEILPIHVIQVHVYFVLLLKKISYYNMYIYKKELAWLIENLLQWLFESDSLYILLGAIEIEDGEYEDEDEEYEDD